MKRCLTLKTAAIVAAALFLVGAGAAGALALSGGGGSSSAPPSQAQADAASPDFDSAFGGDAAPPAGEAGARGALNRDVLETATAKLLGITAKDVRAGLQQGKSLAQLAAEHNVTRDALESAIKTAEKTYLDKNVKDALVTQQYADQTLQQVSARIDAIVDQTARARTPAP